MSRKTANRIFGICGVVGVVCQVVSSIFASKSAEYEIEKILDEKLSDAEYIDVVEEED